MSKWLRGICILFCSVVLLSLVGCYDYSETNRTAMVAGISVDPGKDGKKYAVSVEVVMVSHSSESSEPTGKVFTEYGDNIEDCLQRTTTAATKKLLFSHCKLIVFHEKCAQDGIADAVDFFLRNPEYRPDLYLAVVVEKEAKELISCGEKDEKVCSYEYASMIETSYRSTLAVMPVKLYHAALYENDILLPVFVPKEECFVLDGDSAVISGGKMKHRINSEMTQTAILLSGENRNGVVVLDWQDEKIPCRIRSLSVRKSLEEDEGLTFKIQLYCKMYLTDFPKNVDFSSPGKSREIEGELEQILKEQIDSELKRSKEEGYMEIFHFTQSIYRRKPSVVEKWNAQGKNLLDDLNIQISCDIELENFGFSDERLSQ